MGENLLRVMAAAVDDAQESWVVTVFVAGIKASAERRYLPVAVFNMLRRQVVFRRDPVGHELVRSPASMIDEMRVKGVAVGDCDDRSTLGAALFAALGYRVAFVLASDRETGPWAHVLFAYADGPGDHWISMDPQESGYPGSLPPQIRRSKIFPIEKLRQ